MANTTLDPVAAKLDQILTVVQNPVIIEGERAGLKQDTCGQSYAWTALASAPCGSS